jgi:uncharacterized protein (TIGR02147 family)
MDLVYQYERYRPFLLAAIGAEKNHGSRSRLARAAGCSPSWITRVLSGEVQLTPDQAYAISQHLHLNERESDYFLLLVDKERAATLALRKRIEKKCADLKREGLQLSSAVNADYSISEKHRVLYYSTWAYPTLHVACMIRPSSVRELAAATGLPIAPIGRALGDLLEMGLVRNQGPRWEATNRNIHLPSDHALTNMMHANWRAKTSQQLQEFGSADGLHYSGVHCLSRADIEAVHRKLKESLLGIRRTIDASPSEAVAVFCLDWYALGHG